MDEEYHNRLELTMVDLWLSLEELSGQPLELLAREGAQVILTVALEEEVTSFGLRGCSTTDLEQSVSPCSSCGKKHRRWDTISRLATLSRQLDLFFTG